MHIRFAAFNYDYAFLILKRFELAAPLQTLIVRKPNNCYYFTISILPKKHFFHPIIRYIQNMMSLCQSQNPTNFVTKQFCACFFSAIVQTR